jgi:hypothetical protein
MTLAPMSESDIGPDLREIISARTSLGLGRTSLKSALLGSRESVRYAEDHSTSRVERTVFLPKANPRLSFPPQRYWILSKSNPLTNLGSCLRYLSRNSGVCDFTFTRNFSTRKRQGGPAWFKLSVVVQRVRAQLAR